MAKDRIIILIALVFMLLGLGGAALLMPRINYMRRELQLVAHDDLMKNLPPKIALTQAALGSFRGLAVDVLWGRATQMKQDGKFYEANELARIITQLQPRFPEVWRFHAWNMAYNISVATYTPQERWKWVSDGIDLLREEGIPLNPNAVTLYRELSWIFLHKIGQLTDDSHWYYKEQIAAQWNDVLGAPPEGDTARVIEWFRPVAVAYEKYVNDSAIAGELKRELEAMANTPALMAEITPLQTLTLRQLEIKLPKVRKKIADQYPDAAKRLANAEVLLERQLEAALLTPTHRLLKDRPDMQPVLDRLAEMKLKPDMDLLRLFTRVEALRRSPDAPRLGIVESNREFGNKVRAFLDDPEIAEKRELLLAFTRALVIDEQFHMDPLWMLELMEGEWFVKQIDRQKMKIAGTIPAAPLDWRHPGSHGLYWAALGVKRSRGILRPGDYDVLNTDRQVVHALQLLTQAGKIIFDPLRNTYGQPLPDPRYIDAYHYAIYGSVDRVMDPNSASYSYQLANSAAQESFESGHENFLTYAVQIAYLYGDEAKAQHYYDMVRKMYTKRGQGRDVKYSRPIDEFVMREIVEDEAILSLDVAVSVVSGFLSRAIELGMINGNVEAATRFQTLARRAYDVYQAYQNYENRVDDRGRVALPPFDQMRAEAFINYMRRQPQTIDHILGKARVWNNSPQEWRRQAFDQLRPTLYAEATEAGLDPARVYPEPEGMEAFRKASPTPPALLRRPGDTIGGGQEPVQGRVIGK